MILAVCISWVLGATLGALIMALMASRNHDAAFEYGVDLGAKDERVFVVKHLREAADNVGKGAPEDKQSNYDVAWGALHMAAINIEMGVHLDD